MSRIYIPNHRYHERRQTIPGYKHRKGLVWYPCVGSCGNFIPGPLYVVMHRLCVPCQRRRGVSYGRDKATQAGKTSEHS